MKVPGGPCPYVLVRLLQLGAPGLAESALEVAIAAYGAHGLQPRASNVKRRDEHKVVECRL